MTTAPVPPAHPGQPTGAPPPRPAGAGIGSTSWPTNAWGWAAVVLAVIGLGAWFVLPLVTTVFADIYPVTDTFVMPVVGLVLTVLAAVVNVLVVWLGRQRSVLNVALMVLTLAATLFFGFFVIGEGLGGA